MLLWQFVLDADRRTDLTDPASAADWLASVLGVERDDGTGRFFAAVVLALRSVAARYKHFKSRRPHGEPGWSDAVFRVFVRQLRANLNLGRGTADVAILPPTAIDDASRANLIRHLPDVGANAASDAVLLFAVRVFASLVVDQIQPVCGFCGSVMPHTPHGKASKARYCSPKCRGRGEYRDLSAQAKRQKVLMRKKRRSEAKGDAK